MGVKWFLEFFNNSDDMKTGCAFLSIFSILGIVTLSLYCNSDTYHIRKMGDISIESKSASMSYDFNKAHEKLIELKSKIKDLDYPSKGEELYHETFNYIFNAEAMYLCAKGDNESIDRLVFLLASIPIEGLAVPEGTEYESWVNVKGSDNHERYINFSRSFNQKCDILIDLAISNHNYRIIERIIPLYKLVPDELKDSEVINKEKGVYVKHKVKYNNNNQEVAKKKVNKAIKEGVFLNITDEIKD